MSGGANPRARCQHEENAGIVLSYAQRASDTTAAARQDRGRVALGRLRGYMRTFLSR
jgi:hypothetical protein